MSPLNTSQPISLSTLLKAHMRAIKLPPGHESYEIIAKRVNLLGVTDQTIADIANDVIAPSLKTAEALCHALELYDSEEATFTLAGVAFLKAAREEQSLGNAIKKFGAAHNATTYYALGKLFSIRDITMKLIVETGRVSERRFAVAMADRMNLAGVEREDFFLKTGWHVDKEHIIKTLKDKTMPLSRAIASLCAMEDKSEEDMYTFLKVPQTTFNGWVSKIAPRDPGRIEMLKMAGKKCFKLDRKQTEVFLEAADCFIDKAHVVDALRDNRINILRAGKALMETDAGSVADYAEKIHKKPNTVARWGHTPIPRDRLKILVSDLPIADQRYFMERAEHFLDPKHIAESIKLASNPSAFIDAFKDVYGLTERDFGVGHPTLNGQRRGNHGVRMDTLVKQFVTVEEDHPQVKSCWDAYKHTCARHAGHRDDTHASDLFLRQMDEEHARQMRQR
jgi:DNA-binding XRE family transcriptional regulator